MKDAKSLDLTALRNALRSLEGALVEPTKGLSDFGKRMFEDSFIQRFEYTYEMAWKSMKRFLELAFPDEDLESLGRRDLFRRAKEAGLIENTRPWFAYLKARNETAHVYDEEVAEDVLAMIGAFAKDTAKLLAALESQKGV